MLEPILVIFESYEVFSHSRTLTNTPLSAFELEKVVLGRTKEMRPYSDGKQTHLSVYSNALDWAYFDQSKETNDWSKSTSVVIDPVFLSAKSIQFWDWTKETNGIRLFTHFRGMSHIQRPTSKTLQYLHTLGSHWSWTMTFDIFFHTGCDSGSKKWSQKLYLDKVNFFCSFGFNASRFSYFEDLL